MVVQTLCALWLAGAAPPPQPRPYRAQKPPRHFVTVYVEKQFVQANHFEKHPLEELLGQEVNEVHLETFHYRTKDNLTLVTVREFRRTGTGVGVTVYPFGSSDGATLAVKGSIESIPTLRLAFTGPAPAPVYELAGGRAIDVGAGIEMSDRSPGMGLGSHAYAIGGIGRAITDQRSGVRYFAEGGGGVMFGPFGVDIAFKYVVNRFSDPVVHSVHMIPISVRATVSF